MNHSKVYRRIQTMVCTILLAGFLLFIAPMSSMAQTIGWEPLSMFFENVAYDTTEIQTLTLTNTDPGAVLIVSQIEWTYMDYYDPPEEPISAAFSWETEPLLIALGPGDSVGVDIAFSPKDDGVMSFVMGDLLITSNALNTPNGLSYSVMGMGASDIDADGVSDVVDNCVTTPNGVNGGTCVEGAMGDPCMSDAECGDGGYCSMAQEDTCPPDGNGIGDACDCEGNFDCDDDVDGSDAFPFKEDFGRSVIGNPCEDGNSCNGDMDCDQDVDGSDAFGFKEDFGRSPLGHPCPPCTAGIEWCFYPQ